MSNREQWIALADQADDLAVAIGDEDEAARDSARFIALRLRRLADAYRSEEESEVQR